MTYEIEYEHFILYKFCLCREQNYRQNFLCIYQGTFLFCLSYLSLFKLLILAMADTGATVLGGTYNAFLQATSAFRQVPGLAGRHKNRTDALPLGGWPASAELALVGRYGVTTSSGSKGLSTRVESGHEFNRLAGAKFGNRTRGQHGS